MLCLKKKLTIISFISSLVFCSVFLSFFFFGTSNVFAVSDAVITIDQTNYSSFSSSYICADNLQQYFSCSDYDYMIIDFSFDYSNSTTTSLSLRNSYFGSYFNYNIPLENFSHSVFTLNNNTISYVFIRSVNVSDISSVNSFLITITLTEHNPFEDCPDPPSGSITLSDNGTYDVTSYAEAFVDVPPTVIQGDYHDDLLKIYNAIMICGAIVLVLYFFYCIYRMIIKSVGGKF